MNNKISTKKTEILECEKTWVFCVLMLVAGFYGCYTLGRFGVFCNAQTGNFVCLALYLGKQNWIMALNYLLPTAAYFLGAIIPEIFASKIKKLNIIRWDTFVIFFEIVIVVILSFLPNDIDIHITMVVINFICSIQFTTFRKANGRIMATTFCTAHWREVGVSFVKFLKHKNNEDKTKFFAHFMMILSFIAGGIISSLLMTLLQNSNEEKTLLFAVIPLTILLIDFLYADFVKEKGKLNLTPQGH